MSDITSFQLVSDDVLLTKIYYIRGHKVMLDADLAALYEVETKHLNRQVKRNAERFPDDFRFELTKAEYDLLRYQSGTLKRGAHTKYLPSAFTDKALRCFRAY